MFLQVPAREEADSRGSGDADRPWDIPPGGRVVLYDSRQPDLEVRDLTSGFSHVGRPDLSFDGEHVLFTGRQRPTSAFGVWEVSLESGDVRPVVTLRPEQEIGSAAIYLSSIYTIDAVEPARQIAFAGYASRDRAPAIFTCRMDGTETRRITFDPCGSADPFQLSDGRLVFRRCSPSPHADGDVDQCPPILLSVHTDGADVFLFGGSSNESEIARGLCETPDGDVVFVESTSPGGIASRGAASAWDSGGRLAAVSRSRPLAAPRSLTAYADGVFHSPSSLSDGNLLLSHRDAGRGTYGIYLFDTRRGRLGDEVFDHPAWDDVYAVTVEPRPAPAGRSSVVADQSETGLLYCLDAYRSDVATSVLLRRDRIRRVGVIRPAPETATSAGPEAVRLGEIDVEADGSFLVEVPARTPLRLELLDEQGGVLMSMRSWFWVMPNEARGCIGCHEDRELSPPNRRALALRKPPQKLRLSSSAEVESSTDARSDASDTSRDR